MPTRLNISQVFQIFGIFLPPLLNPRELGGIIMSEISSQQNDILQIKMGLKLLTACCSFANCCAMYSGLYQPFCHRFYQIFPDTKLTVEHRLQYLWNFLTRSAKRQFLCCSSEPQEKLNFLSWNPFQVSGKSVFKLRAFFLILLTSLLLCQNAICNQFLWLM